jgi:hypothetical protein
LGSDAEKQREGDVVANYIELSSTSTKGDRDDVSRGGCGRKTAPRSDQLSAEDLRRFLLPDFWRVLVMSSRKSEAVKSASTLQQYSLLQAEDARCVH